jgi:hypothetical protein
MTQAERDRLVALKKAKEADRSDGGSRGTGNHEKARQPSVCVRVNKKTPNRESADDTLKFQWELTLPTIAKDPQMG